MDYEIVIGLECHVQLLTQSKMFCGCATDYDGAPPNTRVCPVCLGLPGALPVINRKAVEYTVITGLALHCQIAEFAKFDRKNYHYPDLAKGYQISQYDLPLTRQGWLDVEVEGQTKRVGITRVHLEEDTAKNTHLGETSLVDYNRAGVPLMEIVTEPDLRSPEEARVFASNLRRILRWIGVSTGDMEAGALRVDANISVRPQGQAKFGTKTEIKNMNSFRAVKLALEYEAQRQIDVLEHGGRIVQETRGWVEGEGRTVSQRSKEFAHDYRYFPEPDLPPLVLSSTEVERLRAQLPELPEARAERLMARYGLSQYDAGVLTGSRAVADYYEAAVAAHGNGKAVANWVSGEMFRLLRGATLEIEAVPVSPQALAELLRLVDDGTIGISVAKTVLEEMFATGQRAGEIVRAKGLTQISDQDQLRQVAADIIAANPKAVADYRGGKPTAVKFLVGQVMRATRGQANPTVASEILEQLLNESNGRQPS
ncbi:MAG: Asp-tRNA(Asn)/Glu-tRNA(Gln) amidotransferase subunit GatB [Anaerolineae bacterium]|nr:Asp-tRNA(Asn)/Glu-tRNA(Gln) amidotransferase subunit GatB [Anaerolineae bacterium]